VSRVRAAAALGSALVALAGCGGSSAPPRLSRAAFVARADGVCRVGMDPQRDGIPQDGSAVAQTQGLANAIGHIGRGLARLHPPADHAVVFARVLRGYAGFARAEHAAARALAAGDAVELRAAIARIGTAQHQLRRDTIAAGIDACAPQVATSGTDA
jgi:hypothetical protein